MIDAGLCGPTIGRVPSPPHTWFLEHGVDIVVPHKTHDLRNLGVRHVEEAEAVMGVFLGIAP